MFVYNFFHLFRNKECAACCKKKIGFEFFYALI